MGNGGSTHQNPDWGIETHQFVPFVEAKVQFNPPESRLGD